MHPAVWPQYKWTENWGLFFTLHGKNDVAQPKDGPFWGYDDERHYFGNVFQKPTQKGREYRHFRAKCKNLKNGDISETIDSISPKCDDETHTINGTS